MTTSSSFLPWLALGAVGYVLFSRAQSGSKTPDEASVNGPQPLQAGVKYLFLVRLEKPETEARAVLESKGVESLLFGPAAVTPFWAKPGDAYGTVAASFMATPRGSSSITLGDPFYGVGRLESLTRLDGQPFGAPPPGDEGSV
jgi:hypothetical protein